MFTCASALEVGESVYHVVFRNGSSFLHFVHPQLSDARGSPYDPEQTATMELHFTESFTHCDGGETRFIARRRLSVVTARFMTLTSFAVYNEPIAGAMSLCLQHFADIFQGHVPC